MKIERRQQHDNPGPLRISRCTLNNRLPEDVLRARQLGHNPMDNLQAAEFAPGIVRPHLTIGVGAAEQTRQTLQTLGIGRRLVDTLYHRCSLGRFSRAPPCEHLREPNPQPGNVLGKNRELFWHLDAMRSKMSAIRSKVDIALTGWNLAYWLTAELGGPISL